MRFTSRSIRGAGLGFAALMGAYAVAAGQPGVSTRVGDASVALGEETARVVEQVSYREDVTRLGDVILVDGQPRDPIGDPEVLAIWEIVDSTWPDYLASSLRQLSVFSDSSRGLVGVIHPASGGGWILSLDAADLDSPALIKETIVHELSHVLTLDPAVFAFGDGPCDGVRIELGCAASSSVLADFAEAFWPSGVKSSDQDDFVNAYAATAAHEDLAETFTAMVLGWAREGDVVDAKVAMLQADPGLAALAEFLGDQLG